MDPIIFCGIRAATVTIPTRLSSHTSMGHRVITRSNLTVVIPCHLWGIFLGEPGCAPSMSSVLKKLQEYGQHGRLIGIGRGPHINGRLLLARTNYALKTVWRA
jgi:hypothetical protein